MDPTEQLLTIGSYLKLKYSSDGRFFMRLLERWFGHYYYCNPCNGRIYGSDEIHEHLKSNRHANNLLDIYILHPEFLPTKEFLFFGQLDDRSAIEQTISVYKLKPNNNTFEQIHAQVYANCSFLDLHGMFRTPGKSEVFLTVLKRHSPVNDVLFLDKAAHRLEMLYADKLKAANSITNFSDTVDTNILIPSDNRSEKNNNYDIKLFCIDSSDTTDDAIKDGIPLDIESSSNESQDIVENERDKFPTQNLETAFEESDIEPLTQHEIDHIMATHLSSNIDSSTYNELSEEESSLVRSILYNDSTSINNENISHDFDTDSLEEFMNDMNEYTSLYRISFQEDYQYYAMPRDEPYMIRNYFTLDDEQPSLNHNNAPQSSNQDEQHSL